MFYEKKNSETKKQTKHLLNKVANVYKYMCTSV